MKVQNVINFKVLEEKKKIEVVAAIIKYKNEILCVQRPSSKYDYISRKFEFPGGKIEDGETNLEALKRELIEELNLEPNIKDLYITVVHKYPDFELTMHAYMCYVESKQITLNEHIALEWLSLKELIKLDWATADLPIVDKLLKNG